MNAVASERRPPVVPSKGLHVGALGLLSSVVIAVASAAPAYSLAATLGLVVIAVGVQSPLIVIVAFVPILFTALGYKELNAVDPDCGTTFTWAARAFGPRIAWMGGWAIVAADVLVMASLAQITGQYTFLLLGAEGIGHDATSVWVLAVGVAFIAGMTWLCVRGLDVSARVQRVLLSVELVVLVLFATVALVRVYLGAAPVGAVRPSWSWFNPAEISSVSSFVEATLLMVFIYWGWDSSVSINEETEDSASIPGRAAVLATVLLVGVYVLLTVAAQAFAGVGTEGVGLANPANVSDVLSAVGAAVFGDSWLGTVLVHLLLLMVLTSAAASTQTTILPTARTTFAMAVFKALPDSFARVHPRYLTPTVSTVAMGAVSAALYVAFNFVSGGAVISDAVSAIGVSVGFYYGLTGLSCAWLFRDTLLTSPRHLFVRGVLPATGGLLLLVAVAWTLVTVWAPDAGFTSWTLPFPPHYQVGGVFLIGVGSMALGVPAMALLARARPAFFRGEVLRKGLPQGPEDPES